MTNAAPFCVAITAEAFNMLFLRVDGLPIGATIRMGSGEFNRAVQMPKYLGSNIDSRQHQFFLSDQTPPDPARLGHYCRSRNITGVDIFFQGFGNDGTNPNHNRRSIHENIDFL